MCSWIDEIHERIQLKAGNVAVPKSMQSAAEQPREEKPMVKKRAVFGSGITEEQLEKIIRDFEKR